MKHFFKDLLAMSAIVAGMFLCYTYGKKHHIDYSYQREQMRIAVEEMKRQCE